MNNFCVLPFDSVSIAATGQLRPCCNAYDSNFDIDVKDIPIEQFINNKKIISLRESFLSDKKDQACDRCWNIEKIGNRSFRHVANDDKSYGLKSIIPIKKQSHIEFEDIQYLDITLGNKCNLACRMCNPFSSSLLAKQLIELKEYRGPDLIDFSRSTKDKILDLINKCVNLNSLYLLGGEPLISEFHDEIVDLLIQTGRAKSINIHYSTNLQIDIEKYLAMWENFRFVDLNISIDGSHQYYEYIRWPGKWQKVFNNLKRACEFRKEANFYPVVATTSQNLNACNIYDLISECTILSETYVPFFFIPVTGGNYLEIMPTELLENEVKKLKTLPDPYKRVEELIQHYKSSIEKSKNLDKNIVTEFFIKQKKFDSLRNQNLFLIHPYMKELADKYDIEVW
jgi:MoaA/NifB/PqqE/SkfB family radical SAM enzyme